MMTGSGSEWLDEEAGPLVRSYALTRGRTRVATGQRFELIAIIVTVATPVSVLPSIWPEHLAILELCVRPLSVAEISANLRLPLIVARVLLDDLLDHGFIVVRHPEQESRPFNENLLREVLHGLEAL
jgi:hypothetical protein